MEGSTLSRNTAKSRLCKRQLKPFASGKQHAVRQGNTKNTRVFVRQVGMSAVYPGCKHIPEFLRRAGILLPAERPQQDRRSMSGEPLSRDRTWGLLAIYRILLDLAWVIT